MDSLESLYPQLVLLWDKEHNTTTPDKVSIGSHYNANWTCNTCGYVYSRLVCNQVNIYRQRGLANICPICRGKMIIPEYNSFKAVCPEIVESEWDYEKNSVLPDHISPHTNKKVWWRCPIGHSYSSSPNNKLNGGGDCPYCSHKKVSPETSLLTVYPEIAKEWHPTRNDFGPAAVLPKSNIKVWWKCSICGNEFQRKIYQRVKSPFGCKECNKGRQTSVSEQLVFRFLSEHFSDAINTYIIDQRTDIDIYIPSIRLGVEYDGARFHKNKLDKDVEKSKRILSHGIKLIRIREKGCPSFSLAGCESVEVENNLNGLNSILPKLYSLICTIAELNIHLKEFDFQQNLRILKSEFSIIPYHRSLESYIVELEHKGLSLPALWDYEKNAPLTPLSVTTKSAIEVYWLCPKNPSHKGWKAPIHSVVNGYGCKICSNRRRYTTEEWIAEAKRIHGNKYDYSQVRYVDATTPVEMICPIHGIFEIMPSYHLSGNGCRYCAGLAFHSADTISIKYPELVKEWDIEKNLAEYNVMPENISFHDRREFFWHCNYGKPHSYKATIWNRVKRGYKCAVCHGKQVTYDMSLACLNPQLASEWCAENDKTPEEVTPKSDYNALWKCPNPNHEPYRQRVEVRSRGVGCIFCSRRGKKHPKDYEDELRTKHPNIKLLIPFNKASERVECQCMICGYIWSSFPYNLLRGKGCPQCKQ